MDMRYLLEAATAIKEDKVHMELRGDQMAMIITDEKGEHKNVILPHR
jgi:DNA polymerase III sliding clamp (beta) subunit (PCNA family)